MPVRKTDGFRNARNIEQDVAGTENKLSKLTIDSVDQIPNRAWEGAVEAAKQRFNGRSKALKDANRVRVT